MTHSTPPHAPRRLPRLFAATALAVIAVATFAGAAEAEVSWRGNYETGSFGQWNLGVQQLQGPATIVRDRVREGGYAARFEARPKADLTLPGGDRSEALTRTSEVAGSESWWAWSTYFDTDFNPNPDSAWNVFTQWHHTGSTGQANVSFMVDTASSPWNIQINAFGGDQDQNKQVFRLADFQRNVWYDFVFHVRWAPDNTGFVEVWVNGERVVPLTYRPTTYAGMGVYLKQGLYRGESSLTSVVYHDGMRRGTSFADVATQRAWRSPVGQPSYSATAWPFTASRALERRSTSSSAARTEPSLAPPRFGRERWDGSPRGSPFPGGTTSAASKSRSEPSSLDKTAGPLG